MKRRRILVMLASAASLVAAWWLFGFTTTHHLNGTVRTWRVFGRITKADIDWDGDGVIDQSLRFTWGNPMRHHQPPVITMSDHDADGRWDLWVVPGGEDTERYPLATFSVDTDRDGRPDWTFVDHWQSQETYPKIRARRGF
jgi:hypothetical protein